MIYVNNLPVVIVTFLGGPSPTIVWALSFNTYTVSGDNPPIVYISTLLLRWSISVPLSWIKYCVITPLGVSGGVHCKIKELELTSTISDKGGSLGTTKIQLA